MPRRRAAFLVAAVVVASQGVPTPAQPKPAPPPPAPPHFPTLATAATLGVRAGGTADLTLTGTNLQDAVGVLTTAPGVTATRPPKQTDAGKLVVKLAVPAGTPVGVYQLRVVTKYGVSNVRPLTVDELPEVAATPAARKRETAQPLPVPCVAVGTAAAEASDYFKIPVRPGQRLTVEAFGRRLGSPIDPVIVLSDARTGRELPGLYADDTPGAQSDARLTHTFAESGEVVVEVRDTTYKGGGEFGYRLRVADAPGAVTAFPLAVQAGKPTPVGFAGPGLDGVPPVTVTGDGTAALVRPKRAGGATGWPVPVLVSDEPQLTEAEPNNDAKTAQKLPVPGGVSAAFAAKGDIDVFAFPGKKGQKLEVVAAAYELNSPAEVYLRVLDAKGAELAKSDPAKPTARAEFTPPADGEYYVAAEHLNYQYGPTEVYHLSVRPVAPAFEVAVGLDRVECGPGRPGSLPVTGLTKLNGFNAPVELTVVGDGLAGSVTLPAGANPQNATPLFVPVTVKPGTRAGGVPFRVKATAKIDGKDVVRWASAAEGVKATLGAIPNPPPEMAPDLAAAVVETPLFELAVTFDKAEVAKGGTLKGKVTAKRADGFADEIAVAAVGLPANVAAKLAPVPKGKAETTVELTPAANAPAAVLVQLRGTAKHAGRDFAYASPPLTVAVSEAKKPEPAKKDEPKKK
jgi:hypothetical protein